jgi:hypothetical protein
MRIHISESTKVALCEIGKYRTQPRGEIPIKGKGLMNTHWLLWKEDDNATSVT